MNFDFMVLYCPICDADYEAYQDTEPCPNTDLHEDDE